MKKYEEVEKGSLYLCVHKHLIEKAGMARILPRRKVEYMLGVIFHIPDQLRFIVLKEMEHTGMIKMVDRSLRNVEIMPLGLDFESQIKKLQEEWILKAAT